MHQGRSALIFGKLAHGLLKAAAHHAVHRACGMVFLARGQLDMPAVMVDIGAVALQRNGIAQLADGNFPVVAALMLHKIGTALFQILHNHKRIIPAAGPAALTAESRHTRHGVSYGSCRRHAEIPKASVFPLRLRRPSRFTPVQPETPRIIPGHYTGIRLDIQISRAYANQRQRIFSLILHRIILANCTTALKKFIMLNHLQSPLGAVHGHIFFPACRPSVINSTVAGIQAFTGIAESVALGKYVHIAFYIQLKIIAVLMGKIFIKPQSFHTRKIFFYRFHLFTPFLCNTASSYTICTVKSIAICVLLRGFIHKIRAGNSQNAIFKDAL